MMMTPIYLFEDSKLDRLFPLTMSRAAFELRCGALTLLQRAQRMIGADLAGVLVRDGIAPVVRQRIGVPVNPPVGTREGVVLINARWLMLAKPGEMPEDSAGLASDAIVWMHLSAQKAATVDFGKLDDPKTLEAVLSQVQRVAAGATMIERPWDLLHWQNEAILLDFAALGPKQRGTMLGVVNQLGDDGIHISAGAVIYPGVVLDGRGGPIMIGEKAEIKANAVITGPVAIGDGAVVRTMADIREGTVLGPGARVGGEVIGSIFFANANKQHHGFVGQSIVGEFANLGAGTTTSNLKNTYGIVRMPINNMEESTGKQFLGAVIGDHAKIGIGTYLSTGSVVGFASHITTPRPPKFVPSFAWVTGKRIERVDFEKVVAIATTVLNRRGMEMTQADVDLFVRIAGDWALREQYMWEMAE
jgi:UDP-N-acetylglucosamine diphosphorylase/glucosamine-1-phosphate N-acetyltransferase